MHQQLKQRFVMALFLFLVFSGFIAVPPAQALTCQEVRQLTAHYLRLHFSYNQFDDELSRRTLDSFIKTWDPGKVYFLQSDVDKFTEKYATKLDDMINKSDCSAIEDIANVYSKRFEEVQKQVSKLIEQKFDFTKDEYLITDRKNLPFPATTEEVVSRWSERIKFQFLQLSETVKDDKIVREKLKKRYDIAKKRQNEMTSKDLYRVFLSAFSTSLDPHSDYMPPEQLEEFRIASRLSLEGIGAVLRSEDGFTSIQSLVPGGAAFKTGKLAIDDKIVAVGDGDKTPTDVVEMDLKDVVKLIRGPRGTEVRLTIVRKESGEARQFVVPIIREAVQLQDKAAKSRVFEVPVADEKAGKKTYRVGVIELPSFYIDFEGRHARNPDYRSSSVDMIKEIGKLKADKKGVDAILVDLRSNGGGSLDESIKIAGLFVEKGPIVQTKGINNTPNIQNDDDPKSHYSGPLVVLIDRQSASASEIFAGAIQDYQRGLIVGDHHTFGKGTVQNLTDLSPRLGAIKVTISKFYRPSGNSTQSRGVESDIVFPSMADALEIGEKHYDYALEWEKIKGVKFKNYNAVKPYLPKLKEANEKRLASNKEFKEIFDALEEFEEKKEERKRISLRQKSKEELAKLEKEKADEEKKIKKDEYGNIIPDYEDDVYLKEAVQIAVDYARLQAGQNIVELATPRLEGQEAVIVSDRAKSKDAKVVTEKAPDQK